MYYKLSFQLLPGTWAALLAISEQISSRTTFELQDKDVRQSCHAGKKTAKTWPLRAGLGRVRAFGVDCRGLADVIQIGRSRFSRIRVKSASGPAEGRDRRGNPSEAGVCGKRTVTLRSVNLA
jgi:hypothetical protein